MAAWQHTCEIMKINVKYTYTKTILTKNIHFISAGCKNYNVPTYDYYYLTSRYSCFPYSTILKMVLRLFSFILI